MLRIVQGITRQFNNSLVDYLQSLRVFAFPNTITQSAITIRLSCFVAEKNGTVSTGKRHTLKVAAHHENVFESSDYPVEQGQDSEGLDPSDKLVLEPEYSAIANAKRAACSKEIGPGRKKESNKAKGAIGHRESDKEGQVVHDVKTLCRDG